MPTDRSLYPGIPSDFPITEIPFSISGGQPKLTVFFENGKYFQAGMVPSQVAQTFDMCEDLAVQFVQYCERKVATNYGSQEVILRRVHAGLLHERWCTPPQSKWVLQRTAQLLHWPVPADLQ